MLPFTYNEDLSVMVDVRLIVYSGSDFNLALDSSSRTNQPVRRQNVVLRCLLVRSCSPQFFTFPTDLPYWILHVFKEHDKEQAMQTIMLLWRLATLFNRQSLGPRWYSTVLHRKHNGTLLRQICIFMYITNYN